MTNYSINKSPGEMTALLSGKTIAKVEHIDGRMNSVIRFVFTDGSMLEIEYDWVYGWEVSNV